MASKFGLKHVIGSTLAYWYTLFLGWTTRVYWFKTKEAEELECIPQITEVKVPKGIAGDAPIKFKLDYAFSIN